MSRETDTELETQSSTEFEVGQVGLWTWDARSDWLEWDGRSRAIVGDWPSRTTLASFDAAIHPDDRARKQASWRAALDPDRGGGYFVEYRLTRAGDGRNVRILETGRTSFADGIPVGVQGVVTDVTARRASEAALQRTAKLMAGIVSIAADAIISIDAAQRITLFNSGAEATFGYRREEVVGLLLNDLLPEQYRAGHGGRVLEFSEGDVSARRMGERGEIVGQRKNGEIFPAEASISKLDIDGERVYTAVLRDVSERRKVARQLQDSKSVLEIALEAGQIGLYEHDHVSGIINTSPLLRQMCGLADMQIAKFADFQSLVHADDRQKFIDTVARSLDPVHGGTCEIEFRLVRPDGVLRWLTARAHISFRDGRPERTICALLDITERRQAQTLLEERIEASTRELKREMRRREESQVQLVRTQRMEAFGQLTGGIAHDFNNLLTVITGNLELLEMRLEGEKERSLLKRAQDAADMGARLTSRLLTFARRRRFETTALNLNEHVIGLAELLERTLGEHITLTTVLERTPWTVLADGSEIENAVLNLAINARDAMPNGGKLVIQTSNVRASAHEIGGEARLPPGDYVRLSMSDTGVGMPPEVLEQAFEPFFTTKEPGKGTGLGLSTIYGFVQQSRGAMTISSEPGQGTTVNVYLPRALAGSADTSIVHSDTSIPDVSGLRVLLVEDNPDVGQVAKEQLEALGCLVADVANGPAALNLLTTGQAFDVVFSDVVMAGGMSGFEVARWVQLNVPGTAVLLASGYPDTALRQDRSDSLDHAILLKPYSRIELAQALRRVLDHDAGTSN